MGMKEHPQLEWAEAGGARFLRDPPLLSRTGVLVAFTSRRGGVSKPPYDSLNLAFHVGDCDEDVMENRRRICEALGLDPGRMTCAEQVHGIAVAVVDEQQVGRGHDSEQTAIRAKDALATCVEGVALAMFFADCVPVVLVDTAHRAAGVAHAGRKGALGGVVPALVEQMSDSFGSLPADMLAYVGSAIGPCCYEVGPEAAAQFTARFPGLVAAGDTHLDLAGLVTASLDAAGVQRQNIAAVNTCTADSTDIFYSYRAEGGRTGRHAAIAAVLPG